jgi:hypothetical protein
MMFMNEWEIEESVNRHARHEVLGPAARFLRAFMWEVNAHSDGWPYWSAPVKAAKQLMELVHKGDATESELRQAMSPIKAFMTKRGIAAGMTLPTLR